MTLGSMSVNLIVELSIACALRLRPSPMVVGLGSGRRRVPRVWVVVTSDSGHVGQIKYVCSTP